MTQIGFVGLGRMGGGMVARIRRDSDHEVVAFDPDREAVARSAAKGARGRAPWRTSSASSIPRGSCGSWCRRGSDRADGRALAGLLEKDDTIVDGGNSRWTDDKRRAAELRPQGIHYVDVGTSGGVWGLEVGYCMMVGGPTRAVRRLAPILDVLAPPTSEASRRRSGRAAGCTWARRGPDTT